MPSNRLTQCPVVFSLHFKTEAAAGPAPEFIAPLGPAGNSPYILPLSGKARVVDMPGDEFQRGAGTYPRDTGAATRSRKKGG